MTGHLRFYLALTFHEKPWRWEITPGKAVCTPPPPPDGPEVTRSQSPFSRRDWLRACPAQAGTGGLGLLLRAGHGHAIFPPADAPGLCPNKDSASRRIA